MPTDTARIRRRQLLAGGVAAGLVWSAPSVTRVDVIAAQQSAVAACADEPAVCGPPFGATSHVAEVGADGLAVSYFWSDPVAGKLARIVAWVLCCGATAHGDPAVESVGVASGDLTARVQLSNAELDSHCGSATLLTVRTVLVWSVVGGGAHPLSVPGSAVVDVALERVGGIYSVVGSGPRSEIDRVCFPLAP